jgi:hypothetical protein
MISLISRAGKLVQWKIFLKVARYFAHENDGSHRML